MSTIDTDLKYTKNHEWLRLEDDFGATCGISDHAQETLVSIIFVDLPDVGAEVKQGEAIAAVESSVAVSDILSPVTGVIIAVNKKLEDAPELINSDPYGDGWIFKIDVTRMAELEDLLDAEEYQSYIDEGN